MIGEKNSMPEVEARIECLMLFLSDQGFAVPLPVLNEAIARYEGAFDWVAFEAQLRGAPKQPGPRWPELSPAEQQAMQEVFSDWDPSLSFQSTLRELRKSEALPAKFVKKPGYRIAFGADLAEVLSNLAERFEANLPVIERRALEACLANWSGFSYDEVLELLDTEDEDLLVHLQVGDSQRSMTNAELAKKIRAEYRFFLREHRLQGAAGKIHY